VVIDFPKNIQQQKAQPRLAQGTHLRGYNPRRRRDDIVLNEIIGLIEKAERPVLYCGGGVITGHASQELREFVEATQIPHHHHYHGRGRFSGNTPAFTSLAGHARDCLRELGRQRRVSNPVRKRPTCPSSSTTARISCWRLACASMIASHRQSGEVLRTRTPSPHRHRPFRATQKQAGATADRERHQIRLARLNEMIKKRPIQKKFRFLATNKSRWKTKGPLR